MTVIDNARLVWNARAEASRLHRLHVDTARHQALLAQRAAEQDARIYHCPGCGDWRYRHSRGVHGARTTCAACGHHDTRRAAA